MKIIKKRIDYKPTCCPVARLFICEENGFVYLYDAHAVDQESPPREPTGDLTLYFLEKDGSEVGRKLLSGAFVLTLGGLSLHFSESKNAWVGENSGDLPAEVMEDVARYFIATY